MMLFNGNFAWRDDCDRVPAVACVVIVASELEMIAAADCEARGAVGTDPGGHPCVAWCRAALGVEGDRWERAVLAGADAIVFERLQDAEAFQRAFRDEAEALAAAA